MSAHFSNQPIAQISVEDLVARLNAASEPVQLVDVREPEELAIAHLPNVKHLPLSQFSEWSGQIQAYLDPHAETVVMCHHGMRSAQMCQWLVNQGFTNVRNLAGGIDAYSDRIDPTVPRY
ncbi:rhodanese-related sulfurtransferase [Oculatella sp. LEGE 06141]|uniref:rhodanese-like domain-containing protein n=1 Tax=Oculatella sp. LEGE 06141 TaxID=1828648 RepID=UPI0018806FB8|nr:rhodanese-like domain-containing protein [Oculatella sp. LEGE 06141]MBE9177560.1 rhodanese-related sulfurtransferase [Oculatella sp. LEGE 06141]